MIDEAAPAVESGNNDDKVEIIIPPPSGLMGKVHIATEGDVEDLIAGADEVVAEQSEFYAVRAREELDELSSAFEGAMTDPAKRGGALARCSPSPTT